MGKAIFIIGAIVLAVGLLGFTPIADLLPVSLNALFSDGHTYYRVVPVDQSAASVPAILLAAGLLLCGVGIVLHRRRKIR